MRLTGQSYSRQLNCILRDERGAVAVETALAFMLVMTMVLGIVEFSMMAYTFGVLEESMRDGVRYAAIHGTDSTSCSGPSSGCGDSSAANVASDVTAYANAYLGKISGMSVTVTYPDGASTPNSRVQVAISYQYQPLFAFPGTPPTLSVSAVGRIIY